MPTPLQGYVTSLQGNGTSLQGSSPLSLQGNTQQVQGTTPVAPKKVTYGNAAATSPKQQYMDSISTQNPFATSGTDPNAALFASNGNNLSAPTPTTSSSSTPNPPVPPQPSALDTARSAYLQSLSPDTGVSDAQKKYNNFVTSEKLGETALEGQGRGIPLGLVRGQQEKLNQQSELEASRLLGEIGIAQGSQTANQNKAKAALDFATTDAEGSKPVAVAQGSNLVRLNPTTGKYETVASGDPKPETLPASAQEYEYAVKNGYKGTYDQYQTEDANRKRSVTNIINGSGLSTAQANLFSGIVDKYNKSPLIAAADRAVNLENTIKNVKANPNDGAQQLNMVYQYIGALDNYQTGVKEGELQLVGSLQSKIGAVQNAVNGIASSNKPVDSKTALQIANAAEDLINSIKQAATQKAKSFQSQATTLGLGDAWNTYQSGFTPTYSSGSQNNGTSGGDPLGIR